jgi:uncharacterized protein (DUF58 family)
MRTAEALLDHDLLARLERLALMTRRPVSGWAAGQRRSRRPGRSVEFCDYRPYGAGDDPRYIDWSVYGRSDRLVVKVFVDDEDLCLHLLVDASASMDWGDPPKLRYAARLAAALGFVGLSGHERVGLGVLRDRVADGWPPARGRSQILPLLDYLRELKASGNTDLNRSLIQYASRSRGSGVVVLVSDLLDPSGYQAGLRALLERRLEVHLLHVLAPDEIEPTLSGDLRLVDQETRELRPLTIGPQMRADYRERMRALIEDAESFCRRQGILYQRLSTAEPVENVLLGSFRGRLFE